MQLARYLLALSSGVLVFYLSYALLFVIFLWLKLDAEPFKWIALGASGLLSVVVYFRLAPAEEPTADRTRDDESHFPRWPESLVDFLADSPRKIGYAVFALIFWATIIVGPITLGARTAEVYNITTDGEGRWTIQAPDSETAEIAKTVLEFSIYWTKTVLDNVGHFLAAILASLLWAMVAHRGWHWIFCAGSFLVSVLSPWLSFGLWIIRGFAWKAGYNI